jgi:hypothetical protein
MYQNVEKYIPNDHNIIYINYVYNIPDGPKIDQHIFLPRPSTINPNWNFLSENIPSGNHVPLPVFRSYIREKQKPNKGCVGEKFQQFNKLSSAPHARYLSLCFGIAKRPVFYFTLRG